MRGCWVSQTKIDTEQNKKLNAKQNNKKTKHGSLIIDSGRLDVDAEKRIANASKAFGALRQAVFDNSNLSIVTKRQVYRACVLSMLLYSSKYWVLLKRHLNKLNCFLTDVSKHL